MLRLPITRAGDTSLLTEKGDRNGEGVHILKRGRLEIRPGQPLSFVEDSEATKNALEPPADLMEGAREIARALKAYLMAAKVLLEGRYSGVRDIVPAFLRDPCDVTVVCCRNGVIVRYDVGTEKGTKFRLSGMDDTLTKLGPMFTDSLIHFPADKSSYDPGPPGITLEIKKGNIETGPNEVLSTARPIIFAASEIDPGISIPPPPARPPCLVSCTNELNIALYGFAESAEPATDNAKSVGVIERSREFIAVANLRMAVGWQALEIYPRFEKERWNPDFASLWAENDILAAVTRRQMASAQLAAIDPNAAARRQFKNVLDEFARLLDGPEEPVHQYLKQHHEILCPFNVKAWSKLSLGSNVTDFVFREPTNEYLLVEIESPLRRLFRKDGQPRQELVHSCDQITNWRTFIENNLQSVQQDLGLVGISTNPKSMLVIGRSSMLTAANRQKLVTLQGQSPRLQILTFDDLIQYSKATAENLFGPLDLIGQNVEIYFPRSTTKKT